MKRRVDQKCGNCAFFGDTGEVEQVEGWCQKLAPRWVDGEKLAVFPNVFAEFWCGEWEEESK